MILDGIAPSIPGSRRSVQQGSWKVLSTRLRAFPPVPAPCYLSSRVGNSCSLREGAGIGGRASGSLPFLPLAARSRDCSRHERAGPRELASLVLGYSNESPEARISITAGT